ncbi:MAG: DUF3888 domain-containing protein [Clostridiaceae bacterium]|nr:DUF3888 domain-containing protein [Clostridiaceae bacterium]
MMFHTPYIFSFLLILIRILRILKDIIWDTNKNSHWRVIIIKKALFICCLLICLLCYPTKALTMEPNNNAKQGIPYEYTPKEGSMEELYKDIIVTFLEPYISSEVETHYGRPLQYDLFDIKFLKIERPNYRSFEFIIKLQIRPFVAAHNTIGIDDITIRISPGKTKVEEFKHIKTFPIPPHLKEYYKDLKL